jgi:hypothetical protein
MLTAANERLRLLRAAKRGQWKCGDDLLIAVSLVEAWRMYRHERHLPLDDGQIHERARRRFCRRWMKQTMRINAWNKAVKG